MQPEQEREIILDFVDRTKDHLYTIEQGLLNLEHSKNPELVNQILRAVHSVREEAKMLCLICIEKTAHLLENCIRLLREHPIKFDQKLESLFLQGFDALDMAVKQLEESFGLTEDNTSRLISQTEPVFQALNAHLAFLIKPRVRFAEIEQLFPLASAVQEAAQFYRKHAEVKIEGGEILLDKSSLEHFALKLLPPLVNNAIAHGIELPEVRLAAGKSPAGNIAIRAFYQGNQTAIAFDDDGAGIDVERVKAKAIEKRLITPASAATLTRVDV